MNSRSPFLDRAKQAIADPQLQALLDRNGEVRRTAREAAFRELPNSEELRAMAKASRREVVSRLDHYVRKFVRRLEHNDVQVHVAGDGSEAAHIVVEIAQRAGAKSVAKSKSMVTEEIALNEALASAGIAVVETDLGERIVQLRGEKPSHILTPALHLTRDQVADTFSDHLNQVVPSDVEQINRVARDSLRNVFFEADVGVSGVNFGVAETGTLCLISNEGNGRMVTSLPPIHIAVMGIERLVPTLADLATMLRVLPRSATGQKLTSYVSLINTPRREADPDGASERHVVLVDNGRSQLVGTPLEGSLDCIRCGACLSACPVFREAGGHSYESVYSGPIGSVISPALFGVERYGHLAKASTLCGACVEACPVGIDIPRLLLEVRAVTPKQRTPISRGVRIYAWLGRSPRRFGWAQRFAAFATQMMPNRAGWVTKLPGTAGAWTEFRDFPPFSSRPLRTRVRHLHPNVVQRAPGTGPLDGTLPLPEEERSVSRVEDFEAEIRKLGGEVIRCPAGEVADRIVGELYVLGASRLLTWGPVEPVLYTVLQRLEEEFSVELPELPSGSERASKLADLDQAQVGITGSLAAFADTGTVVLSTASRRSQLPSLLPRTHIVIVRVKDVFTDMESWMAAGGSGYIANSSSVALITGPSRTADIEMTLTVGVHGPKQLIAVVVE